MTRKDRILSVGETGSQVVSVSAVPTIGQLFILGDSPDSSFVPRVL